MRSQCGITGMSFHAFEMVKVVKFKRGTITMKYCYEFCRDHADKQNAHNLTYMYK